METPPSKYFRLRPGGEAPEVWLYIKCEDVIKGPNGEVVELLHGRPGSKSGGPPQAS
jgi:glutaminyl-tRNA synthetase